MTVHEAVRALRRSIGDTQQEFANRMGWGISTVVRYEASRVPNIEALVRLRAEADDGRRANRFTDDEILKAFDREVASHFGRDSIQAVLDIIELSREGLEALVSAHNEQGRLGINPFVDMKLELCKRSLARIVEIATEIPKPSVAGPVPDVDAEEETKET